MIKEVGAPIPTVQAILFKSPYRFWIYPLRYVEKKIRENKLIKKYF